MNKKNITRLDKKLFKKGILHKIKSQTVTFNEKKKYTKTELKRENDESRTMKVNIIGVMTQT